MYIYIYMHILCERCACTLSTRILAKVFRFQVLGLGLRDLEALLFKNPWEGNERPTARPCGCFQKLGGPFCECVLGVYIID